MVLRFVEGLQSSHTSYLLMIFYFFYRSLLFLWRFLLLYGKISGQMINYQKSEIFFINNTEHTIRHHVASVLGVNKLCEQDSSWGYHQSFGETKSKSFGYLKDISIWKHINQWSTQHLSNVGNKVLIKSIAQSIPTYCMSVDKEHFYKQEHNRNMVFLSLWKLTLGPFSKVFFGFNSWDITIFVLK